MRITFVLASKARCCYFVPMPSKRRLEHQHYHRWLAMKQRCYNPNDRKFEHYGGRGIYICEEWYRGFWKFAEWCERTGWQPHLTLDRIDNDGPYSPDNCRWATREEQIKNRRARRSNLVIDGVPVRFFELSEACGIKPMTLRARLMKGWSLERAMAEPVRGMRAKA